MKQLKFKLISNNSVEIDEEVNYFIKDDTLKFKIKDELYDVDLTKKILTKSNKESTLKIDVFKKLILIHLNKEKYDFDMLLESIKFENISNNIKIEYTFESDVKTTNCIFIDY